MRKIFIFTFFVLFATTLFAQDGWDNWKPYSSESYYDIQENSSDKTTPVNYDIYNPKFYVTRMQNRFLSVDKLADQYPGVTPYHYVLNNPMRFLDPTGMWVASYDSSGNVVSVSYEEGDTYEDLYSQLGISADEFSKKYGIDLSKGITTTTFDITSFVVSNTGFDANMKNGNCFGFVMTAKGIQLVEGQGSGNTFLNSLGNPSTTNTPVTGDVAVWNYTGNGSGYGETLQLNGIPAHAGIFIVNNQAGEAQFLNRATLNAPVTVSRASQVQQNYNTIIKNNPAFQLPSITLSPHFFKMR